MAFRDDDLAAQSRVDVLQGELKELRAENEALKRSAAPAPKRSTAFRWILLSIGAAALCLAALIWSVAHGGELRGLLVVLTVSLFGVVAMAVLVWRLLVVVPPGHIGVFSGRSHVGADGQTRGFRVVMGGSTIRIPLIERHDDLSLGPFPIESVLRDLYTSGGGRMDLKLRASVAVGREEPFVLNAIERFVGREESEIAKVGRETLEGVARGIAAGITLRELREDRARVAQMLMSEAQVNLEKLGLTVESLDIVEFTEV